MIPRMKAKEYINHTLWEVNLEEKGSVQVETCILLKSSPNIFISKGIYETRSELEWLFADRKEAEAISQKINRIRNTFDIPPYVSAKTLLNHYEELLNCEEQIKMELGDLASLFTFSFTDVSAGGIQVVAALKEEPNYSYGDQITIKYDFSNISEVPQLVSSSLKDTYSKENVESFKDFLRLGEEIGWD